MIYFGTRLSENISRREPEGYLICLNVPVARTGMQEYLAEELGMDPGKGRIIPVWRPEEEVFDPACIASFEGMPVTNDHPTFPEGVTAENIRYLQKGHAHNIRRGAGKESDLLLADLIITDTALEEEILNGKREISCGYNYVLSEEGGRYIQREIRGNHVAVVDAGRAGPRVSIRDHDRRTIRKEGYLKGNVKAAGNDSSANVERSTYRMKKANGMNTKDRQMKGTVSRQSRGGVLSAGRMAKIMAKMARDGETEELAEVIAEIMDPENVSEPVIDEPAAVADPVIAEAVEEILESDEEATAVSEQEAPVEVTVPESHEITIDCGGEILDLLRQIVSLLTPAADCGTSGKSCDECSSPDTQDEDPSDTVAEALAEAVTTAVEAAANEQLPPPDADPMTALVEEVIEQAVAGEAAHEPGNVVLPGDAGEQELAALLIEPEKDVDMPSDKTTDALRAAMVTFRPLLKNMAPGARRKAVAKIAANLKAMDKNLANARGGKDTNPINSYARLMGAANHSRVSEPNGDLGRKIMEARNPHYKGNA